MFVQRGMFDAAASEGEVAGVMAHELSHVLLRHGTANATKAQNPWLQLGQMAGAIGGAVVGGAAGSAIAQGSQFGLGTLLLRYSRDFEKQADLLGAQIMARAGYDPRALAHMFETIASRVERRRRSAVDEQPPRSGQPHALHHERSRSADDRPCRGHERIPDHQSEVCGAAATRRGRTRAMRRNGAGGGSGRLSRHAWTTGAGAGRPVPERQRGGLPGECSEQLDRAAGRKVRQVRAPERLRTR